MMELDASNGHSANNQCTHFQICRINIGDFIADTRERERERATRQRSRISVISHTGYQLVIPANAQSETTRIDTVQ